MYAAQATPQFDAEIAEKGHLWMETILHTHYPYTIPVRFATRNRAVTHDRFLF